MDAVGDRIGRYFARSEPRRRAVGYLRVLLGDAERENGWQLAELLGEATPDGVQHLLARADWDADAVREELMDYVGAARRAKPRRRVLCRSTASRLGSTCEATDTPAARPPRRP